MSRTPPEGAKTATGVGDHVSAAVATAAAELELDPSSVHWSIDKSWFRNELGGMIPRDDVRVIVWARDPEEVNAVTEAQAWLTKVLDGLGLKGSVTGRIDNSGKVRLAVDVDKGGRLVGRRGSTLQAVSHLLTQTVGADFPDREFTIDVADGRRDDDDGERRGRRDDDDGERRGRRDRGDRRDRGERRDRGDRGDRRERSRGRGGDDDAKKLRSLARKIAQRVARTGEAEVIRKELNSFDRRTVHMALADFDGVGTRSLGEGNHKQIEIYADGDAGEE